VILAKQIDREGVGFEIKGMPDGTIELEIRDAIGGKIFLYENSRGFHYPYIGGLAPGTKYKYRVRIRGQKWSAWEEFTTRKGPSKKLAIVLHFPKK